MAICLSVEFAVLVPLVRVSSEWFEANWGDIRSGLPPTNHAGWTSRIIWLQAISALSFARGLWRLSRRDRQGILAMHAEAGVQVRQRTALAIDLAKDEHGFRITLATGEVIRSADSGGRGHRGPSPQRFGADSGPTAFTTLYGNEQTIAGVLRPDRK